MRLPFASRLTPEAARFQWRLLVVLALVVLATAKPSNAGVNQSVYCVPNKPPVVISPVTATRALGDAGVRPVMLTVSML